jgi:chromosome segregation ATPase
MAKKPEPDRKIKLPGGSEQSISSRQPAAAPARGPAPAQQRGPAQAPAQRQQGPGPSGPPTDDVGRAVQNLERSAQVRSKHDLPDRVKVITPDVIKGIVHSIIDKYVTDGVTADELAQLTADNTQMQLRLQQVQGREQGLRDEVARLQGYVDELQGVLDQNVEGRANADQAAQYYDAQIRDLQQKNAQMVDLYADAQRQMEEASQAAAENEAALDHTAGELVGAQDALAAANAELEQLRNGVSTENAEAEQFAEQLGADLEATKAKAAELQARVEELEATVAERDEAINQERQAREKAEREVDEANGMATAKQAEAEKLRKDTTAAEQYQSRIAELESELATAREKVVNATENASGSQRELQEKIAKLQNQVRDYGVKERKYEQIDAELEKLRTSEGKWLEERRNIAAQLSHETNLRREVEQKLKAIEKGEIGGHAAEAKFADERKKHEAEVASLNEKLRKAERDAETAKEAGGKHKAAQEAIASKDEQIKALEKQLRDAKNAAEAGGESAKGELSKSEEKLKKLNDQVRELSMIARKYDNVAAELEGLRAAEGKWLEEKRVMASQVTHEADLRKKLEAQMGGMQAGDVVPRTKLDESEKELKHLREELEALKKKLLIQEELSQSLLNASENKVNERSLGVLEDENARLERALDEARLKNDALSAELAQKGGDSKRITMVQSELARIKADLEIARTERDGAYNDLNAVKDQLAVMRKLAEQGQGGEELKGKLHARDVQLTIAQQQILDFKTEITLHEEASRDAQRERDEARREAERKNSEIERLQAQLDRLKERAKELEAQAQQKLAADKARDDAQREADRRQADIERLQAQLDKLREKNKDLESNTQDKIVIEKEVAARSLSVLEAENEKLRNRVEEITQKRDELRNGLERAMAEIKGLQEELAKIGHGERGAEKHLAEAQQKLADAEKRIKELETESSALGPAAATAAQVARELEDARRQNAQLSNETDSLSTQLAEAQQDADKAEAVAEKEKAARHEHEVALAEVRARLEAEIQVRLERDRRITALEAEVTEEREQRMNSAPASAMESLAAAVESERKLADDRLAAERDKWETRHKADLEELQRQRELTKEAEMEAAAIQDRIDEFEGKSQEAKQESIEAKRLSGQRRAQIERMQSEVERARTSEHEKEVYWKSEMISLETKIRTHLEAAERKEPGADTRMVRVLEEVGVGVFDKYAKARKRLNKLEKDHEAAGVKIKTLQKIIDAHQKQGALLKKLEEQSSTDVPKRTGKVRKKK